MHPPRPSGRTALTATAATAALVAVSGTAAPARAKAADAPAHRRHTAVIGSPESGTARHRSDHGARSWERINDDAHQGGRIGEVIVGDPRVHGRGYLATSGRGYLATDGRGIQYGEPVRCRA